MRWLKKFRFRLGTLLFVLSASCLWLGMITEQARKQREALAVLEQCGATVYFDYQFDSDGWLDESRQPPVPAWARRVFGEDYFRRPVRCDLPKADGPLAEDTCGLQMPLSAVYELSDLETLIVNELPLGIEDLRRLATLRNLATLDLTGCAITDSDLVAIHQIRSLVDLDLTAAKITDAGLAHLADLPALQSLNLCHTAITDEGVATISRMRGIRHLVLDGTAITNGALRHLKTMPSLTTLSIHNTAVDDFGLGHLQSMPHLEYIRLAWTKTSGDAKNRLEGALPDCLVDDCRVRD